MRVARHNVAPGRSIATVERKLAAILAADVVGYSRLAGLDETGAVDRLEHFETQVIRPLVDLHGGRIFKTMGDGYLVEFASAVAALSCAVDWQKRLSSWRVEEAHDQPLRMRIGLHLGDVVVRGDDILGNGVIIATRLEGVAEPDGICVSDDIRRHARALKGLAFEPMGAPDLKNIADAITAWSVHAGDSRPAAGPAKRRRRAILYGLAGGLLLVLAALALLEQLEPVIMGDPASDVVINKEDPSVKGILEDRVTIAVLPFENFSDDKSLGHDADGFVEDLTSDLAGLDQFAVESRVNAFKYREKNLSIVEIAKLLGVGYVIEGSFRPLGDKVRVNVQFIEGLHASHFGEHHDDVRLTGIDAFRKAVVAKLLESFRQLTGGTEVQ